MNLSNEEKHNLLEILRAKENLTKEEAEILTWLELGELIRNPIDALDW